MLSKQILFFESLILIYFGVQSFIFPSIDWALALNGFAILSILMYRYEGLRLTFLAFLVAQILLVLTEIIYIDIMAIMIAVIAINYFPVYQYPNPTGKYLVGFKQMWIEGLDVSFFYPTKVKTRDVKACPHDKTAQRINDLCLYFTPKIPYFVIKALFNHLDERKLGVNLNAPIAHVEEGKTPLILFSHGLAAHKHMYSAFLKEWASHGFIVAAVDHPESVFLPVIDELDFIQKRKPQLKDRRDAITRVLDFLYVEKNVQGLFQDDSIHLNYDKIFGAGHSFGGATVLECGTLDFRIRGGLILLDPWLAPCEEMILKSTTAKQPLLSIRSSEYDRLPLRGGPARRHALYSKAIRGDKQISGYFDGANHNTFIDGLLSWSREFAMFKLIFNIDQAKHLILSYLRLTQLFLDQAMKGEDETKGDFDQCVISRYNGECKKVGLQDYFIVDSISSLSSY